MKLTMASSPHNHSHKSVTRLMLTVIAACIPGVIAQVVFFGTGVLIQLLLALVCVSAFEATIMLMRKRPIWPALSDGSAWLTGVLLANKYSAFSALVGYCYRVFVCHCYC